MEAEAATAVRAAEAAAAAEVAQVVEEAVPGSSRNWAEPGVFHNFTDRGLRGPISARTKTTHPLDCHMAGSARAC